METVLLWLFLFMALSLGWCVGRYSKQNSKKGVKDFQSPGNIKHRLQLLFDSYSDDSLDRFIHSLEVTPETLATHISIGNHFRVQGEVEKAILIHQNLMAHPELSDVASEAIIYELAKDYKAAGLFDRAESLLEQLSRSRQFGFKSLTLLLDIYEHEKDWNNALKKGKEIDLKRRPEIALRVAQYCCEIAEEKLRMNLFREAKSCFNQALTIHKMCIRAQLGLAQIALQNEEYSSAIQHLKQLSEISPENIVITLPLLLECTKKTNTFNQHQAYLNKLLMATGQLPVIQAIVESMVHQGERQKAKDFLLDTVRSSPSLVALNALFKFNPEDLRSSVDILDIVADVLEQVSQEKATYKCVQCGFTGNQLHWICPSCKSWQSVKPVVEYERLQ